MAAAKKVNGVSAGPSGGGPGGWNAQVVQLLHLVKGLSAALRRQGNPYHLSVHIHPHFASLKAADTSSAVTTSAWRGNIFSVSTRCTSSSWSPQQSDTTTRR